MRASPAVVTEVVTGVPRTSATTENPAWREACSRTRHAFFSRRPPRLAPHRLRRLGRPQSESSAGRGAGGCAVAGPLVCRLSFLRADAAGAFSCDERAHMRGRRMHDRLHLPRVSTRPGLRRQQRPRDVRHGRDSRGMRPRHRVLQRCMWSLSDPGLALREGHVRFHRLEVRDRRVVRTRDPLPERRVRARLSRGRSMIAPWCNHRGDGESPCAMLDDLGESDRSDRSRGRHTHAACGRGTSSRCRSPRAAGDGNRPSPGSSRDGRPAAGARRARVMLLAPRAVARGRAASARRIAQRGRPQRSRGPGQARTRSLRRRAREWMRRRPRRRG